MKQGYVQVYTGDGKGKTTAAVGLAMRAAAAGLRVYFCQFMKYGPTGELDAFRLFGDRIVAEQFGTGGELSAPDPEDDAQAARRGLAAAREAVLGGAFDVVVLDEANVADSLGYFEPDALVDLALERPETVELVVTGRGAAARSWPWPTSSPRCARSSTTTRRASSPAAASSSSGGGRVMSDYVRD